MGLGQERDKSVRNRHFTLALASDSYSQMGTL